MRTLKSVYPDYADRVEFIGVGTDPTEDAVDVRGYADRQGYTWDMAPFESSIVADFRILSQSSKVAINGDGVITYRSGYGSLSANDWRNIFEDLLE